MNLVTMNDAAVVDGKQVLGWLLGREGMPHGRTRGVDASSCAAVPVTPVYVVGSAARPIQGRHCENDTGQWTERVFAAVREDEKRCVRGEDWPECGNACHPGGGEHRNGRRLCRVAQSALLDPLAQSFARRMPYRVGLTRREVRPESNREVESAVVEVCGCGVWVLGMGDRVVGR